MTLPMLASSNYEITDREHTQAARLEMQALEVNNKLIIELPLLQATRTVQNHP